MADTGTRFAAFLILYIVAAGVALPVWHPASGAALTGFLALSAVHFALDDLPDEPVRQHLVERAARELMPIVLPAMLHRTELAALFAALSAPGSGTMLATAANAVAPEVGTFALAAVLVRLRDGERRAAAELVALPAVLAVLPPLVGFALCFALVHSRGQTLRRMRATGAPDLPAYLLSVWPTLAGAGLSFLTLGVVAAGASPGTLATLFVGLSALTVPHLLVTPLFERPTFPQSVLPPLSSPSPARRRSS